MKKFVIASLLAALCLSGCGASTEQPAPEDNTTAATPEQEENLADVGVFPTTDGAFIGDTMPFFDGGKMNVFYLADQRDGKTGYHPWALIRTEDYWNYEEMGVVIPYAESGLEQDIALGTGSVIKDKSGMYHAFYTGHNDIYAPKEAIMHATSSDMLNWTKIPGDTFIANENYSQDDFRDPYVIYVEEEQCYWMLVVTRKDGSGVIAKYTSTDLSKWKDDGVFFADDMGYGTNMECPTLLKYNNVWYLTFSDQWPDRLVHVRVSDSINGPFKAPAKETFDGNGFYAGRLETDGENLYCIGWNATKVGHSDENDYSWAGNMVVHQVKQMADGSLQPVVNEKVKEKFTLTLNRQPLLMSDSIKAENGSYTLSGNQYELVQFDSIDGTGLVETDISGFDGENSFGISFAPTMEQAGMLNYIFNVKENRIEFYNTDQIFNADPQSYVDFDFSGKDSIHVSLLSAGGVTCLYVNDEVALTARMYMSVGYKWQMFGINSKVTFGNVALHAAPGETN